MNKNTQRKAIIRQLATIDAPTRHTMSRQACQRLLDTIDWSAIEHVYCYQSQPQLHEVDTSWLIAQLRSQYRCTIGIAPQTRDGEFPDKTYDVIIVPLVAFTRDGHRLGRGGGWYDQLLAMQPATHKVGLAYELQRVPQLPIEPHDIALSTIITELHTYTS